MRPVVIMLAVLLAAGPAVAADPPAKRPNVLFLIADDMRPDLGCYGQPLVQSPTIDALAKAGVRFERAYVQYPLCNPSRSSLLTGRYPDHTGVMDNRTFFGTVHPDFVSLPKYFKQHGYVTLRAGKIFHNTLDDTDAWTEGGEPRGVGQGPSSDGLGDREGYRPDRRIVLEGDGEKHHDYKAADRAIEYLRKHKGEPFFLACGVTKPHAPPSAPQRFYDLYDVARISLPPDFAPTPTVPPGFPKACLLPRNIDLFVGRPATPAEAKETIRAYWASLSWADWNLGRVVAELDKLGLRDNTVIVFWGDHGYHLGEKGKWSKHQSLFEVGTRVPFVIAAPGAKGNGKACPGVVECLGLYPTLCELCGLPTPAGQEGRSLKPLLDDPTAAWDHPAFTVSGNANKVLGTAVRTDRFRYVEYTAGGAMLLDEAADPAETKNLADDPRYAKERAELAGRIKAFLHR
ncbi:MAG TPA: sulfatase [Gemmataceae bacterium]|jgi:arylsulfatase A-like enzyme